MTVRSLHIGNNYLGTGADLAGCINDAMSWRRFLVEQLPGITANLKTGLDAAQILFVLSEVAAASLPGDTDWITYSGHGSFVTDKSGDEADGRDECIVGDDLVYVLDDEIRKTLRPAQGKIIVVADSCFSGTVTRAMPADYMPVRKRFFPPPDPIDQFLGLLAPSRRILGNFSRRVLLLSGCNDRQYSYESEGAGVLTTVALEMYEPGMTWKQWHAAIRTRLPSRSFEQSPQLYGGDGEFRNSLVFP